MKDVKYKTEEHNQENILKSFKFDNENNKKKYRSFHKKKVYLIITEDLVGLGSAISTSTLSVVNSGIVIIITSSTALLSSVAIFVTNEYISILKIRYTMLRAWINVVTLLCEKTLKQSMVDKKID